MPKRVSVATPILSGAFWASACSEREGLEETVIPTWRLSEQLRIGSPDDDEYALTQVRPLGTEGERAIGGILQLPAHYPPVTEVLYSDDLSLWVRRERGTAGVDRWEIYRAGNRVGQVEAPRSLAIHVIHSDLLWGVEVDELDVPYVVRYRVDQGIN